MVRRAIETQKLPEPTRSMRIMQEERIKAAQQLIPRIQRLHKETDAIYENVKYVISAGGWPRVREVAADLTNAAGTLEMELGQVIAKAREMRRN